jgi:DNA-binding NtrC family response regulator
MKVYSWPGNVRELKNFIERLVILAEIGNLDGRWVQQLIEEADEGMINSGADSGKNVIVRLGTLEEMEQQLIAAVEKRGEGSLAEVASFLGIGRTTLWKKLKKGNGN